MDRLRPSLSPMTPQAMRPAPFARAKKTAMAVPAIASALSIAKPLSTRASGGYSFMRPMAIRPAPALTRNVSEIRWNCGVRSISLGVNSSPPATPGFGGTNPSGSQPSGGIFIHMLPMTTSAAKAKPYAMKVPSRPMLSMRLPHEPAILIQPVAPKPNPATATPEIIPLRSGNHRIPTAIGTT